MEHVSRKNATPMRTSWSSVAFIVESILLLVFLAASLAVLTKMFSASLNASVESRTLDAATIASGSVAEHFAADPTGVDERTELGDLLITCEVTDEPRVDGTLYHATICAYDLTGDSGADPVYKLTTSRYEPNTTSANIVETTAASESSAAAEPSASAAAAESEASEAAAEADEGETA